MGIRGCLGAFGAWLKRAWAPIASTAAFLSVIFLGLQVYQLGKDVRPLAGIQLLGKLTHARVFRSAACATESR